MIGVAFKDDETIIKSNRHVYQWDTGQKIMVGGVSDLSITDIHFTFKGLKTAYVVKVTTGTNTITADVPNKVLTYGKDIYAYLCVKNSNGNVVTVKTVIIPVIKRNMPENYMYDDDETVYSVIDELQAEIQRSSAVDTEHEDRITSLEGAKTNASGTTYETLKARIDDDVTSLNTKIVYNNECLSKTNSIIFGKEKSVVALAEENLMVFKVAINQDNEMIEDEKRLMVRYTIDGVRRYKLTNKNYLFRIIGYKDRLNNIYENYNKDNILGKGEYTNEYINTWDNCIIIFKRVDEGNITNEDIANLYDSFSCAKPVVSGDFEKVKSTDLYGFSLGVKGDGTGRLFVSKSEISNVRITAIELKQDAFVNIKLNNINRCRIGIKNDRIGTVIYNGKELASEQPILDEVIVDNSSLTSYDFAYYNTKEQATIFMYLSHGEVEPEIEIDTNIKKYIDDNANTSKSPTYKAVDEYIIKDFEPFEQDYSASKGNGITSGVDKNQAYQSTQPDTFLHTFYDPYVGVSDDGNYSVTKTVRGKDESGTWDIFEYDFCPKHYTKTILLTGGEHAYETPASFGLALWVKNLMENTGDADLQWIKNNVRIKMIPMSNPWGFSQYPKAYGNCNGVNPNRNFDNQIHVWDKFPVYSPNPSDANYNEWNYKGEYPFSESETRIWRNWIIENKDDAEFWIDCHTGVYCTRADNWVVYQSTNPLIPKIKRAINALSRRIERVYDKIPTVLEEVDKDTSLKVSYGNDVVGIPTLAIEQADLGVPWWSEYYNSAAYITEYATTVHAYVSSLLMPL